MRAAGKTFLVTGAGNGIGQQVALELLGRGARVVGADVSEAGLATTTALVAEAGAGAWAGARAMLGAGAFIPRILDVGDAAAVRAFAAEIGGALPAIDGVLHIAGIAQGMEPVDALSDERAEAILRVNYLGPLRLTRALLPGLLARPEAVIELTSSMAAIVSVPGSSAYAASKAAVAMLGEGLAHDLRGRRGVTVTTVFPGTVWTDIVRSSAAALGVREGLARRFAMPVRTAARRLVVATLRGRRRAVIGADARLFAVLRGVAPRLADRLAYAQLARHVYGRRPPSPDPRP